MPYRTAGYVEREPLRCRLCETTVNVRALAVAICQPCAEDALGRDRALMVRLQLVAVDGWTLCGEPVSGDDIGWAAGLSK